jgi:copper resistance protein D
MTPDLLSVVVRALGFVALFQAAGAAFFLTLFGRPLTRAKRAISRAGLIAAAVATILVLAHLGLDPARMSGDFEGLRDPDLQQLAWSSRAGMSQLVQAIGLFVILAGLWKPGRKSSTWASLGGAIAVGGFLITGHTSTHALHLVLTPLLALHLLVVAFWFGALLPLILVMRLESGAIAAGILKRFSTVASWSVPLILVAGLTMAWLLAGSLSVLDKPYGELLIAKLASFGLLLILAAYNKWRLVPAFEQAPSDSSLRRSMAAEYVLIVAVLAVTAVLTAFYSPE